MSLRHLCGATVSATTNGRAYKAATLNEKTRLNSGWRQVCNELVITCSRTTHTPSPHRRASVGRRRFVCRAGRLKRAGHDAVGITLRFMTAPPPAARVLLPARTPGTPPAAEIIGSSIRRDYEPLQEAVSLFAESYAR